MTLEVIAQEDVAIYEGGFLNYALDSLKNAGSFDKYAEWLQHEPVCTFRDATRWTRVNDIILYKDDEGEMMYPITLEINLEGEKIYHSLGAGASFFFRDSADDKLIAVYVD